MAKAPKPQPLTFVLHLSGQRKSAQWHAERDSVAGEVTVTGADAATLRNLMQGCFDEDADKGRMPWLPTDAVADFASDLELPALAALTRSDCDCGVIHIRGL